MNEYQELINECVEDTLIWKEGCDTCPIESIAYQVANECFKVRYDFNKWYDDIAESAEYVNHICLTYNLTQQNSSSDRATQLAAREWLIDQIMDKIEAK